MQEKMINAEVWFAINYEMACSPTDFFMRRTGRLFFDKTSVDLYKDYVTQLFKNQFHWDDNTTEKKLQELDKNLTLACTFN